MLKKTIPFLFIALLLIFFVWRWLSSFTPEIQKIKKDLAVDLSLQGITLKQGKDGQIIWELTAKRANYSEEKKEIFLDEIYEDLHLHLYCEKCIRERFKSDAFVLNIKQERLMNFDFKCFVALFCEIINLGYALDCRRSLFA